MSNICPYCAGDMLTPIPEETLAIVARAGLAGEHVDPGGRVLHFRDGRRLRLDDQCNICDERRVLEFLR
jgi:hypothetical protein